MSLSGHNVSHLVATARFRPHEQGRGLNRIISLPRRVKEPIASISATILEYRFPCSLPPSGKNYTKEMAKGNTTGSRFAARRMRRIVKLFLAIPILLAPVIFPKLSAILVPCCIFALIILMLVGPKNDRNWKWSTYRKKRATLDDSSSDVTDLDPANPFGMHDDYY